MRRDGMAAEMLKALVIFLAGGFIYGLVEVLFRGHTHPTMFTLGGLCLLWIGGLDSFFGQKPPLWAQELIGGAFITIAELVCGIIVNMWLGLNVWDYSDLPFNILGQVCPTFCYFWIALSLPAVYIENLLRSALER